MHVGAMAHWNFALLDERFSLCRLPFDCAPKGDAQLRALLKTAAAKKAPAAAAAAAPAQPKSLSPSEAFAARTLLGHPTPAHALTNDKRQPTLVDSAVPGCHAACAVCKLSQALMM
jgi:hypothetical protein